MNPNMKNIKKYIARLALSLSVGAIMAFVMPAIAMADITITNNTIGLLDEDEVIAISGGPAFYRVAVDANGDPFDLTGDDAANLFVEGYGYGYSDGSWSYGYGHGYGYSYFATEADNVGDNWNAGDTRLGFLTGSGENGAELNLSVDNTDSSTVPVEVTLTGSNDSDLTAIIPANTTLSASGWDGTFDLGDTITDINQLSSSQQDFVDNILDDDSTLVGVSITTGLTNQSLSADSPVLVTIPYADAGSLANPVVVLVKGSGVVIEVDPCGSAYTGGGAGYATASNYSVDADDACFVIDSANDLFYVASRTFSSFFAGSSATAASGSSNRGAGNVSTTSTNTDETNYETNEEEGTEETTINEEESTTEESEKRISEEPGLNGFYDLGEVTKDDWRYDVINTVHKTGLFNGELVDGKKMFDMTGGMNRAMAAAVVDRYIGCSANNDMLSFGSPFEDVSIGSWYGPAVACLKTEGIVEGRSETLYAPTDLVTRAEFLKLMIEAYIYKNPGVTTNWRAAIADQDASLPFADVRISEWYSGYMNLAYQNGLIEGYQEGDLRMARPTQTIIRIEAAAIVANFMNL